MEVFDIFGSLVEEIKTGVYNEGEFVFGWEPKDLASGTYLIRMTASASDGKGLQTQTIKALFMK